MSGVLPDSTATDNQPTMLMADAVRGPLTLTAAEVEVIRAMAADVEVARMLTARSAERANELAGNDANGNYASTRHITPKPPIFTNGVKGPNVRMWLRHMKEYQALLPPRPADCVRIAALYLGDEAAEHWYQTRDILMRTGADPNDWNVFEEHMLRVYGAIDVDARAREKLDALTLASCNFDMTEYVRKYTNLLALIPARNAHDQCHFFLKGLPKTVHDKIALDPNTLLRWDNFDRLCTYACRMYRHTARTYGVDIAPTMGESNSKPFTKPKGKKQHGNGNGNGRTGNGPIGVAKKSNNAFDATRWKGTLIDSFETLKAFKKEGRCIFCSDKGHRGRDCKKNPANDKNKGPM